MKRTAILADSTADIPESLRQERKIYNCSTYVIWHGESVRGIDLSLDDFYTQLETDPELPKTSQPAPGEFLEVYEQIAADGYDAVVATTVSAVLSGTYNAAMTAAKESPIPVHIIDSKQLGAGQLMITMAAADARDAGASTDEIVTVTRAAVDSTYAFFTVNSLDHLHHGGRISTISHLIGTLLNIKPIFWMHEGRIALLDRVRSRRKALKRMVEHAVSYRDPERPVALAATVYGLNPDELPQLSKMAREALQPQELFEGRVGSTMGAHTGPSIMGVGFRQDRA